MKHPVFEAWSEYEYEDNEPVRRRILRKNIGIIDMEYYNDNVTMYCPYCKKAGFEVRLGPRILKPNEQRPPDYDQFLQCTDCFETVAAYTVEGDASIIRDEIATIETPFENSIEIMGANARRTTEAGQRALSKRRRQMNRPIHKDKDIDREMQRHGDRVNVIYDSNP